MSDTKTPLPVHPLLEGTTPGPWKVVTAWDDYMVEGPNGEEIIWQSGSHDTPTISKADANLIAMAPTLAAENARLRAVLEHTPNPHGGRYYNYSILCMAITSLLDSGDMRLARELEDVCANQREVLASLTT